MTKKRYTPVPRLSWMVPILAAKYIAAQVKPFTIVYNQLMSATVTAVDAYGDPVVDAKLKLYSSDPEIADFKDGNLVPTGKKFGIVSVLGITTGPAFGVMVHDIEVVPSVATSFKITEGGN